MVLEFRDSGGGPGGGGGGEARQNFSTVLQQIFNWDTPILPAPLTDTESIVRSPVAAVTGFAESMLQNYTVDATTTRMALVVNGSGGGNGAWETEPVPVDEPWLDTVLLVLKATIMLSIMVAAVFGNLLVIASVMRHRKLR